MKIFILGILVGAILDNLFNLIWYRRAVRAWWKRKNKLDRILFAVYAVALAYTVSMIWLFYVKGSEPAVLTGSVYAAIATEVTNCASIKKRNVQSGQGVNDESGIS
jgi:FtsH-binding integral membrane protein